ncbi:T-complex protein 1 subunit delta [Nosema granulosis]|uniref:T-complex protein 1 subunit delta n=1 Tax=Nosema granulosis TaxID=83296 RepID=A0A9P6GXJ2_9MICR|nr:T-complex protein 1 subunit delta [Nosema granulosis]
MTEEREKNIKTTIFESAHALLQTISTSLGPKGLDKMLIKDNKTTVTNDGATILKFFTDHPIHQILSNVSNCQDEECGDGTTSVVVLICSLLDAVRGLVGVHPSTICDHLEKAKAMAIEYIEWVKVPISKENIYNSVVTSLNSKIVNSSVEMAEAAIQAMEYAKGQKRDIRIVKKVGGIVDDISVHRGLLFDSDIKTERRMVKVAAIQFCISAPKTNMDSKILVDKPELMEKVILDERKYILEICKKIKQTGCQLLLIQKSILRDSLSDLGRHFLKQLNILTVDRIERKDIESLSSWIRPVSDVDLLTPESLVEVEIQNTEGMLEIVDKGCTVVIRGCDDLVLDEADRSFNDALSVVRCLNEEPFLVPGGGAVETGISVKIMQSKEGLVTVMRQIAKAFEGIPYFLSQNAGLNSVETLSELRKMVLSNPSYGVSVRGPKTSDMLDDDNVVQPSKIAKSVVSLAIETVIYILKIDDILPSRR